MKAINAQVISDYRAGGEISVEGMHRERIVLLTTTGASSGEPRTTPVMFQPTSDGILVVASDDGAAAEPHWYRNLIADPHLHVEAPDAEYDARARVLDGAERADSWVRLTADLPMFLDQQERAGRQLPLVELVRI